MSVPHIILDNLPSLCQKLSDLVEVWRSYNKNNFACFFETRCSAFQYWIDCFTEHDIKNERCECSTAEGRYEGLNWCLTFHTSPLSTDAQSCIYHVQAMYHSERLLLTQVALALYSRCVWSSVSSDPYLHVISKLPSWPRIWIWKWKVVAVSIMISQRRGVHAYGRVTELSWLLNADSKAAIRKSVPLGDGSRNKGFLETGSWNSEGSSVTVSSQFHKPVCLQVSVPGGLVTPSHAHEGLCTGRWDD